MTPLTPPPSIRSGLQAMVAICGQFARTMKLKFRTDIDPKKSKTKFVIFTKVKNARKNVYPIMLNGDPLPWVDEVKHLGNILEYNNTMRKDCLTKRGKFIGIVNSLLQEFHFVEPPVMMKLLEVYATSFYGSSLWNLFSKEVTRIFSSWNVTVRNVFNLPWDTHRYLIETVSKSTHPKVMMCSRYMKFMESMGRTCKKRSVRYLAALVKDDRRTLTGRTISSIASDCDVVSSSLTPIKDQGDEVHDCPLGEAVETTLLEGTARDQIWAVRATWY